MTRRKINPNICIDFKNFTTLSPPTLALPVYMIFCSDDHFNFKDMKQITILKDSFLFICFPAQNINFHSLHKTKNIFVLQSYLLCVYFEILLFENNNCIFLFC